MGHVVFCILHFFALLFGIVGLIITIPLHLIYANQCDRNLAEKRKEKMNANKLG